MAIIAQMAREARAASPNPVERKAIDPFQKARSGSVECCRSEEAIRDQKVEKLFQHLFGLIEGLTIENGLLKASVEVLKSSHVQSELGHQESLSTQERVHREALDILKGQMELKYSTLESDLKKELADLKKDHLALQNRFNRHGHRYEDYDDSKTYRKMTEGPNC